MHKHWERSVARSHKSKRENIETSRNEKANLVSNIFDYLSRDSLAWPEGR